MCRFCEQAAFGQEIPYDPQLGRGGLVPGANMPPDLILHGGTILTMDPLRPVVGAIALREGVIQHMGAVDDLIAGRGRMTRVTDLEGKAVVPGFVASGLSLPRERDGLSLDLWISDLVRQGFTAVDLVDLGDGWAEYDQLCQLLMRRHRLRLRGAVGPRLRAGWQGEALFPGMGHDLIRVDTMRVPLSAGLDMALTEATRLHADGWAVLLDDDLGPDSMVFDDLLSRLEGRDLAGLRLATRRQLDATTRNALQAAGLGIVGVELAAGFPLRMDRLTALTSGAAAQAGIADICGTLRPGRYADFTILDSAPGSDEETAPRVLSTWLEGVPVRQETDHVAL